MGYMHINNLYKDQKILQFRECYALEKIDGTSAHISFKFEDDKIILFSGGEKYERFASLFNEEELLSKFKERFNCDIVIFGEAYGGRQQGMSDTYGKELKFVAFDVKVDETWVNVPNANDIATKLGIEFVSYEKIPCDIEHIDKQRDLDSIQSKRNGVDEPKIREGVVLRPIEEFRDNRGDRVVCKHKRDEFKETKTKREVNPEQLQVLEDAEKIADEWVCAVRLKHVLDKMPPETNIENTGDVIKAMMSDIYREGKDEIVESNETKKAIGKASAKIFKQHLQNALRDEK